MSTAVVVEHIDTSADRVVCATCRRTVLIKDVLDFWLECEAARDLCPRCSCQLFS